MAADWWIYLAVGCDGKLYCGISTNIERRIKEHNESKRGSKWARAHRPLRLVYEEHAGSKSTALKRERQIKAMRTADKHRLVGLLYQKPEQEG